MFLAFGFLFFFVMTFIIQLFIYLFIIYLLFIYCLFIYVFYHFNKFNLIYFRFFRWGCWRLLIVCFLLFFYTFNLIHLWSFPFSHCQMVQLYILCGFSGALPSSLIVTEQSFLNQHLFHFYFLNNWKSPVVSLLCLTAALLGCCVSALGSSWLNVSVGTVFLPNRTSFSSSI